MLAIPVPTPNAVASGLAGAAGGAYPTVRVGSAPGCICANCWPTNPTCATGEHGASLAAAAAAYSMAGRGA